MAVTAYASADSAPISNPDVDIEIDLFVVSLPQLAQQLYGDAYDSGDPGNTGWNWSWTILDDDSPTNPGVLSSAVVQNPTLDVPTWRNIRIFLIAQHSTTLEYSEQDPLQAPNSAFVHARVLSSTAGLQKLAAGERDYHGAFHTLTAQVETDAGGVGAHDIASHTDTTATGAELETLTDGSNATGLHIHDGPDVAVATVSTQGTVTLEETGSGAAKVITRERVQLQASVDGSRVGTAGWVGGQIVPESYEADQTVSGGKALCIWRTEEEIKLLSWAIQLVDGGKASATHPYRFRLGHANATNAAANVWADIGLTHELTGSPTVDNNPLVLTVALSAEYTLPAGEFLALFCLAAPRVIADGENPGGGLTAQVYARREVT